MSLSKIESNLKISVDGGLKSSNKAHHWQVEKKN